MESRLSVLEVTGRVNNRVDGFLNCGYCGGGFDVNWYPGDARMHLANMLVHQHFRRCPSRGDEWAFEVTVFAGDKSKRIAVALTLPECRSVA